jgi:hypothetical protein
MVPERTILFLISMLLCGAVAAQGVPQLASDDRSKAGKIAIGDGYPAKNLFGSVTAPAPLAARAIGSYARGCLAGGVAVPINGPGWQVMLVARPQLGASATLGLSRATRQRCALNRLARPSHWRHRTASWRANDYRPCEPSDRIGCRHLADPDAKPATMMSVFWRFNDGVLLQQHHQNS